MKLDEFIEAAISEGNRNGVAALSLEKRAVFLISEAEILCDMEGIDTFLHLYAPMWIEETVAAFKQIGAIDIAQGFEEIGSVETPSEQLLDRVNKLVTCRVGYEYAAFEKLLNHCSL